MAVATTARKPMGLGCSFLKTNLLQPAAAAANSTPLRGAAVPLRLLSSEADGDAAGCRGSACGAVSRLLAESLLTDVALFCGHRPAAMTALPARLGQQQTTKKNSTRQTHSLTAKRDKSSTCIRKVRLFGERVAVLAALDQQAQRPALEGAAHLAVGPGSDIHCNEDDCKVNYT